MSKLTGGSIQIAHISEETALAVLDCEAEIFGEIGINVDLDDQEK